MSSKLNLTNLIQCHNAIEHFNYDLAVDWAINMLEAGKETDNVLMLSSFSKPVDRIEVIPYIKIALLELGIEEKSGEMAILSKTQYHLNEIINSKDIRKNLYSLYELCTETDHKQGLTTFYLLYFGWLDLEEIGENNYYDGADLNNIEQILKKQAQIWLDNFENDNNHYTQQHL